MEGLPKAMGLKKSGVRMVPSALVAKPGLLTGAAFLATGLPLAGAAGAFLGPGTQISVSESHTREDSWPQLDAGGHAPLNGSTRESLPTTHETLSTLKSTST